MTQGRSGTGLEHFDEVAELLLEGGGVRAVVHLLGPRCTVSATVMLL